MRIYPIDAKSGAFWKTFPLRISGGSQSRCCDEPTILVQSMHGGFVTRNCPTRVRPTTLPETVFKKDLDLWVACAECRHRMKPVVLAGRNYVLHRATFAPTKV